MNGPPSSVVVVPPTGFVGREREMRLLGRSLEAARVVTVVGAPGVGKTRLAMEHVASRPSLAVEVSDVTSIADLCAVVARAASLELAESPLDTVGSHLAARGAMVLVLDDAEPAVAVAAEAIPAWLDRAPELRILVTSRERLRLRDELVVELGPLPVEGAATSPAVQLLVDRVRACHPHYDPQGDEDHLVALAELLDGIPLALELAAARMEMLGARRLLERLAAPLDVLSRSTRDALARQSTLRTAIGASWELLDETQRTALARCAVFHGAFSLEAAEAVLGEGALDAIHDLRDRSLLVQQAPGILRLYRPIRAFAAEQLDAMGARAEAERAHGDHYLDFGLGERNRHDTTGASLEYLAAERHNLIAILERAVATGDGDRAGRALLALGPVLAIHGPLPLYLELADRTRAAAPDDPAVALERAKALRLLGRLDEAHATLEPALATPPEDGRLHADLLRERGTIHTVARRTDEAREAYEATLAAAARAGWRRGEGIANANLATVAHDIGRFEDAAAAYDRGLAIMREVGDPRLEGIVLTNSAILAQEEGRHEVAERRFRQALEVIEGAGDRRYEGITLGNLGAHEHERGHMDEAIAFLTRASELLADVGDTSSEALARARLAAILADQGDLERAEGALVQAERLVAGQGSRMTELVRLHGGFLDLARGDERAAAEHLEAAERPTGDAPSLIASHDDARRIHRMLTARLTGASPTVEVGANGSWFRAPGCERQDLSKTKAARLILERLARERLEAPAQPLAAEALFDAGWPGVTIQAQSANNRLHVALAKLRKLGLKGLLLRDDEGYYLDPEVPLVRVES